VLVLINHTTSQTDLSALLVNLQPQLKESDDIYILSDGLGVAKRHGSTRSTILVEMGKFDNSQALEIGMEYAKDNDHEGVLFLQSNLVLPHTFVFNLRKASKLPYKILSPILLSDPTHRIHPDFSWFNYGKLDVVPTEESTYVCRYIDAYPKEKMFGLIKNEKVAVL
jgi:hypothetical protein